MRLDLPNSASVTSLKSTGPRPVQIGRHDSDHCSKEDELVPKRRMLALTPATTVSRKDGHESLPMGLSRGSTKKKNMHVRIPLMEETLPHVRKPPSQRVF